jgi:hypothetical protein
MTATTTPNLGLMDPQGSDTFTTSDFSTSFEKLDTVPGILTVANQASLPTGFTNNQHGRRVWQADQNIEWVWIQPSSTVAGAWTRVGCKGYLGQSGNPNHLSTVDPNTGIVLTTNTVLIPGGRPVQVLAKCNWCGNNTTGIVRFTMYLNGTNPVVWHWSNKPAGNPFPADNKMWSAYLNPAPVSQTNVTFQVNLSVEGSVGGGTAEVSGFFIEIYER